MTNQATAQMRLICAAVLIAMSCTACAPKFIDPPAPVTKSTWVERDAKEVHEAIGETMKKEIVRSDVEMDLSLDPDEMVVWVSGVDLKKSKMQRASERLTGNAAKGEGASDSSDFAEVYKFGVSGSALTAEGVLALERFKAKSTDRFYVEFLNKNEMTEEKVRGMLSAWNNLSKELKKKGLNTSNVVMGGGKYNQSVESIVLVKVGK